MVDRIITYMDGNQLMKQKDVADKRELEWTDLRVSYNNSWPNNGKWYSDVQKALDEWLQNQNIPQIFTPVKLGDKAIDILFQNAKLNKLLSGIIDIYDELPYRPDEGFDIAWRSLEILMNHHRSIAWKEDSDKTPHLITRSVKELLKPLADKDQRVRTMWEHFLSDIPLSTLRYAIMRCYIEHDLSINTQVDRVSARAETTLSKALYDGIMEKYSFEVGVKPTADVLRRSSLLLQKILKGDKVVVNNHEYQVDFEHRMIFVLSCILYTNRCERFHGDYFSPFKSDRATMDTYAFSYYLLAFAYVYLWTLLFRHCETPGIGELCSIDSILTAAKTMQERLKPIIEAGK